MANSTEKNSTSAKRIPPNLKLNARASGRMIDDLENNLVIKKGHPPTITVRVGDLKEIIADMPAENDDNKLIFYLASYRDKNDFDRYSERAKRRGHKPDEIEKLPTFLIGWETVDKITSDYSYDVGTIHPPPFDRSME